MAELVDAADLKSVDRKVVGVQVPPRALLYMKMQRKACEYSFRGSLNAEEKEIYEELMIEGGVHFGFVEFAFYEDSKTKRGDFFLYLAEILEAGSVFPTNMRVDR